MKGASRYAELDGLRGLAAILVVFYHFFAQYGKIYGHTINISIFNFGYTGVHLFFIISGFVIFMTILKVSSVKEFAIKRISRLYPAYWFGIITTSCVLVLFPLLEIEFSLYKIMVNFTMLQSFLRVPSVDGVYWSLAVELIFYFFIGFVLLIKKLNNIKIIINIWLLASILIIIAGLYYSSPILRAIEYLLIAKYSYLFSAGIIFYMNFNGQEYGKYKFSIFLIIIASIIINSLSVQLLVIYFWFLLFGLYVAQTPFISNILKTKWLVWLGGISYSLYLLHQNIGYTIISYGYNLNINPFVSIFIATTVSIVLALISRHLIEVRLSKVFFNRLKAIFLK